MNILSVQYVIFSHDHGVPVVKRTDPRAKQSQVGVLSGYYTHQTLMSTFNLHCMLLSSGVCFLHCLVLIVLTQYLVSWWADAHSFSVSACSRPGKCH